LAGHELGDQERRAVVRGARRLAEAAAHQARAGVALAAQTPEGGDDEDRGADDRRKRVARQPEDERPAAAPEPQRLARLDPHAPEDLLDAARLEGRLDVV